MCGIVGFTGKERALPFLLQGLNKLEYRGYDSAGVTLVNDRELKTWKSKGRLRVLEGILADEDCPQTCGIGHTRWATHGVPSNLNAHPHTNEDETIAIVHNGIIENYESLKEELVALGYCFRSSTDSEVVVLLLDYFYRQEGDLFKALRLTLGKLVGSWALCVVSVFEPDTIYVAKKDSPMVLGKSKEGTFCGSDAPALLVYTNRILPLSDGDVGILKPDSIRVFDADGKEKPAVFIRFPYTLAAAQKGGYDSFMMKEIHEQPHAIRETLRSRFVDNDVYLPMLDSLRVDWGNIRQIVYVACGTAYHACIYANTLMQQMVPVFSYAQPASEFRYCNPHVDEHTVCVFVSQSGETADILAALKLAKSKHCATIAVTNVLGSSISRLADVVIYTAAGPEISVASTKAYTTQLVILYLLNIRMAELLGYPVAHLDEIMAGMKALPEVVEKTLSMQETMKELAKLLSDQRDAYFIGRQLDYPSALEGSLKLKEISYVHADAYFGGELKHGPIALIEKNTVVMAIATQPEIAAKTISNIQETVARGAQVILITDPNIPASGFEHVLRIPAVLPQMAGIPSAVLCQLFAYYTALEKGCDIDKPRNLAKSVTVE